MIDLPKDMEISKTFKVADLHVFLENVSLYLDTSSRMSSFEEDGTDEEQMLKAIGLVHKLVLISEQSKQRHDFNLEIC